MRPVGPWQVSRMASRRFIDWGVRQAETSCRLVPQKRQYLTTLGVAQYRLGLYAEAVSTLGRLPDALDSSSHPPGLAILALASHRQGQTGEARPSWATCAGR